MTPRRPRVLLAITVYNGWSFVPACLVSARNLDTTSADVDVLALDDASPEPGFSRKLAELCEKLGVHYYRTPRNLGIVRNVNLGMLTGVELDYDYVIISNSDVIFSRQTIEHLLAAATSDPRIGSVTAWSNNVSIYSLPNADPDLHLASQERADWVAATLAADFRGAAVDIPAGISFCILMPTPVIRRVGLMDPVFGRGYCEETDWSLRSLSMGYRLTLAPAAFVHHRGRGSTVAAGMLSGAHTTVPENEAIIDYRYPLFRDQVDAFIRGGILQRLHRDATLRLVRDGGVREGYEVHLGSPGASSSSRAQVTWPAIAGSPVQASFAGFSCDIPLNGLSPYVAVEAFFQTSPARLTGSPKVLSTVAIQTTEPASHPTYPAQV